LFYFVVFGCGHSADDGRPPPVFAIARGVYLCIAKPLSRHCQSVCVHSVNRWFCQRQLMLCCAWHLLVLWLFIT